MELQTAEKQLEEEQLATRERIDHEINDKIFQLQEELVATELNEGMYVPTQVSLNDGHLNNSDFPCANSISFFSFP